MLSFCDLHVHLGRASGKPVKITASSGLTLNRAIDHAEKIKGLNVLGIIDAACDGVLKEFKGLLAEGSLEECPGGGLKTARGLLLIPGSEWEMDIEGTRVHCLAFFPGMGELEAYNSYLREKVRNPGLSTQFLRDGFHKAFSMVGRLGGHPGLAHAFTPFKGYFGQLDSFLPLGEYAKGVDFVELGLSADSTLADRIKELQKIPFLVGSDAHSSPNIAREYLEIDTTVRDFEQLFQIILSGKGIKAFRGFPPALGKYYKTRCRQCGFTPGEDERKNCPRCLKPTLVQGVSNRIEKLSDTEKPLTGRAPYFYHIPLHLLPGFGPKTLDVLYKNLGSEMEIIHNISPEQLERFLDKKRVEMILRLRRGELEIECGGAGSYGKVKK